MPYPARHVFGKTSGQVPSGIESTIPLPKRVPGLVAWFDPTVPSSFGDYNPGYKFDTWTDRISGYVATSSSTNNTLTADPLTGLTMVSISSVQWLEVDALAVYLGANTPDGIITMFVAVHGTKSLPAAAPPPVYVISFNEDVNYVPDTHICCISAQDSSSQLSTTFLYTRPAAHTFTHLSCWGTSLDNYHVHQANAVICGTVRPSGFLWNPAVSNNSFGENSAGSGQSAYQSPLPDAAFTRGTIGAYTYVSGARTMYGQGWGAYIGDILIYIGAMDPADYASVKAWMLERWQISGA